MSDPNEKQNREPLAIDQWVDIDGMNVPGRIVEIDERRKRAEVLIQGQTWTIPLRKLKDGEPPLFDEDHSGVNIKLNPHTGPAAHVIDLHGMLVEDALREVDYALDRAVTAGMGSMRVIHGHGTGAIRKALRTMLEDHPHVAYFRFGSPSEGGVASTIVELKRRDF